MKMNIRNPLFLVVLSLATSSCAFVPEVDKDQSYANQCYMATRQLTLTTVDLNNVNCNGSGDEICLAAVGVVVPAVTFVVSGSLVVIGNTINWVEYQGTCESGYISKYMKMFKKKLHKS